ncbi:MAG: shikimate kinase [Candidatus Poribacteria bacterium]|nr:shikimate kinase [Candidatus Poribacteria bacterium]
MPNIVLVGFMGTGKTSVGQQLAQRLEMSLIDTDDVIEQDSGMRIADIFDRDGESYFRDLESAAVRKVSGLDNHVISTGGGVVLRESNLETLKQNGVVFCLTATPEEIWEHVGHGTHRPLLQTPHPLEKIRQMLVDRAPYYARADYEILTTDLSIEAVTDNIIEVFQHAIHSR